MFRIALSIRPSPRTVIAGVTRLRHLHPSSTLRSSSHQNKHQGSRLLVVSCNRSPNIPNEAPNAGVVEAFHTWERSRMSTLAYSGTPSTSRIAASEEIGKAANQLDERAMRETRFGAGNWFLRQDEADGRQRRPLMGGVPVPKGLALAMAMSVQTAAMKMRERSLSGITLIDEERSAMRPLVPAKPKWLSLC